MIEISEGIALRTRIGAFFTMLVDNHDSRHLWLTICSISKTMNKDQALAALRAANAVAIEAKSAGKHPFGAVLVAPDHETILLKAGNESTVRHAETELARAAAEQFESEYLWGCTLVTNFEPCVMCTGTIYWANIGRIVYGVAESSLMKLTGKHEENPTLNLPCREVVQASPKVIQILGPFAEVEEEVFKLHEGFWN